MDRKEFLAAAAAPLVLGVVRPHSPGARAAFRSRSSPQISSRPSSRSSFRAAASIAACRRPPARAASSRIGVTRRARRPHRRRRVSLVDSEPSMCTRSRGPFGAPRYSAVSDRPRFAYVTDSSATEIGDRRPPRHAASSRRVPVGGPCPAPRLDALGRRLWVAARQQEPKARDLALDRPPPASGRSSASGPRSWRTTSATSPRRAASGSRRATADRLAIYDDHGSSDHSHLARRRTTAARHLPRRSRIRDERRRRCPARARARRAAAALRSGSGRLVQREEGFGLVF